MSDALRVLLVEDSASDAKLIAAALRRSGLAVDLVRVEDAPALRAALEDPGWHVVVSDWSLPHLTAPEALELVHRARPDLPFIIVSGTIGEDTAVEAMRAGAQDYILKDRLTRLAPAIERALRDGEARRALRASEAARQRSEAWKASIVDAALDAILGMDAEGRITELNPAAERVFGHPRDAVVGRLLAEVVVPPGMRAAHQRGLERYLATGSSDTLGRRLELTGLHADGTEFPIELTVTRVGTEDPPSFIGFVRDMSQRKRDEAALRELEEQLRQSQKLEAIGSLAGGIAHDFNNLLSVILSYSDMLASDLPAGDPVAADLEEIRKAALRAAELTRQLLAFSRRQILAPRTISPRELIAGMERMLRRLLGEQIELRVTAAETGHVKVDPGQLEQVLMNLAVNARDAMPEGGRLAIETTTVEVTEERPMAPGPYVRISVIDTGSGMRPETRSRIFEPFFTTKPRGKGTGLGLSTAFGIIQQSRGHIEVTSEPGRGTRFDLFLPRTDPSTMIPVVPPEPTTLDGTETILLVEDEDSVRALASTILRRHGYRVLEAPTAGDALLICEQPGEPIDLLLTDVVLPRMSGRQLASRLRQIRPGLRVLYMSGYTDDEALLRAIHDAMLAFLQKPITPASLARKVREVLDAAPLEPA